MRATHHSDKARVGLIGAGGISQAHARGILAHTDRVECVAICDIDERMLNERREEFGGSPDTFAEWKTMLKEMGSEMDAVVICLPHHLHAPAILDAVAAGKHILCEKPLCINLDEADRLVEAVRKTDVLFMAAHNQLFLPVVRAAKKMIEEGLIGQVRWLRSVDAFINKGIHADQWRARADLQGGGELIDTGYHPTYRLLHLAGAEPVEIRAVMGRFQLDIEGEDSASAVVSFANGAIGEIMSSWAWHAPHGSHQIHVTGAEGQIFGSNETLFHLSNGSTEPKKIDLQSVDTFVEQMACFADCIRGGLKPPHSIEESRTVLRMILKAEESAAGWQNRATRKR